MNNQKLNAVLEIDESQKEKSKKELVVDRFKINLFKCNVVFCQFFTFCYTVNHLSRTFLNVCISESDLHKVIFYFVLASIIIALFNWMKNKIVNARNKNR